MYATRENEVQDRTGSADDTLTYRHRGWAGVELSLAGDRLVIDPLENAQPLAGFLGAPLQPLDRSDPPGGMTTAVLVTHAHPDHFDPVAITHQLTAGSAVWGPPSAAALAQETGLPSRFATLGESYRIGPFTVTGVRASDGFGDEQLSWVIRGAGKTVLHGGDTIWHGGWWSIARDHGPFDLVFLPINGFVGARPGMTAANVPGALTAHQAVEAAHVLGARAICPIHYGVFNNPPQYVESADPLAALHSAAMARGIEVAPSVGCV